MGTGGESIYGHMFKDESFQLKHTERGLLSMANSGPDSNGSQFFICIRPAPHLDDKHVVFGKVVSGYDVVEEMEKCGGEEGKPTKRVIVQDCGEVDDTSTKEPSTKRAKVKTGPTAWVLQILRKHANVKKPTSWRAEKITCTKEDAAKHLLGLRKQLVGI